MEEREENLQQESIGETTEVNTTEEVFRPMEDFFQTTIDDIDAFEERSWAKGEGYKLPGFPEIENNLEGLDEGMYLLAAESNVGKSAVMMNMIYDACMHAENKLYGIYYSLDDSKGDIIPRVVAMDQRIPISCVSKPRRYQNLIDDGAEYSSLYEEFLRKRGQGLQKLRDCNNLFKIEDGERITNVNDLLLHMQQAQVFVKALDPEANIIVAIDSINDIKMLGSYTSDAAKHTDIAKTVKHWATTDLHIPIFASIHLRKLNGNRRPVLDDLKESGEYVYEASLVWLLHNDVSKNKQSAKVYHNESGYEEKRPIIEFDWAKNKKSSYKGRSYGYFAPEYSKITECNKDVSRRFDALVYEG